MQTIEYRTIDKSAWPRGAWDAEPDKKQWRDAETGLPCLAVRGPGGHWCGYVGVSPDHPWHGRGYSECVEPARHEAHEGGEDDWHYSCTPCGIADVHGGLTFADRCAEGKPECEGVCHKPDAGEPDNVWWFGFDCAHHNDFSPKWGDSLGFGGTYRPLSYVEVECMSLAQQLARAALSPEAE